MRRLIALLCLCVFLFSCENATSTTNEVELARYKESDFAQAATNIIKAANDGFEVYKGNPFSLPNGDIA